MNTKCKTSSEMPFVERWHIERYKSIFRLKIFSCVVILLMTIGFQKSFGQGVGISEVSITPHASSILELRSTQRGFLIPRMSLAERDAIPTPATGLIIYNTTTDKLNIYDGSTWLVLFSGSNGVNSITGTANRISIGGTSADPIIDIDANYAGQASIDTLGTITAGIWNANIIDVQYGGTGVSTLTIHGIVLGNGTSPVNTTATGSAGQVLQSRGASADPSYSTASYPSTSGTAGNVLQSDGTNFVSSATATNQVDSLNPADITNTTPRLLQLNGATGVTITPSKSGKILIILTGNGVAPNGNSIVYAQMYYNTMYATSHDVPITGFTALGTETIVATDSLNKPFSLSSVLTGLTIGTPYYFDVAIYSDSDDARLSNISVSIVEL